MMIKYLIGTEKMSLTARWYSDNQHTLQSSARKRKRKQKSSDKVSIAGLDCELKDPTRCINQIRKNIRERGKLLNSIIIVSAPACALGVTCRLSTYATHAHIHTHMHTQINFKVQHLMWGHTQQEIQGLADQFVQVFREVQDARFRKSCRIVLLTSTGTTGMREPYCTTQR